MHTGDKTNKGQEIGRMLLGCNISRAMSYKQLKKHLARDRMQRSFWGTMTQKFLQILTRFFPFLKQAEKSKSLRISNVKIYLFCPLPRKLIACAHQDGTPRIPGTVGTTHICRRIVADHVDPGRHRKACSSEQQSKLCFFGSKRRYRHKYIHIYIYISIYMYIYIYTYHKAITNHSWDLH